MGVAGIASKRVAYKVFDEISLSIFVAIIMKWLELCFWNLMGVFYCVFVLKFWEFY